MWLESEGSIRPDHPDLDAAIVERSRFMLAEKYGRPPDEVFQWSSYTYNRALFYHNVEHGKEKLTADDVLERVKARPPSGELLGVSLNHFQQFIVAGELNVAKLTSEGGYAPHQVGYIRDELTKAGMLGERNQDQGNEAG